MSQSATGFLATLADPNRDVSESIQPKIETFYCLVPVVFTVFFFIIFLFRKDVILLCLSIRNIF